VPKIGFSGILCRFGRIIRKLKQGRKLWHVVNKQLRLVAQLKKRQIRIMRNKGNDALKISSAKHIMFVVDINSSYMHWIIGENILVVENRDSIEQN